MPKPLLVCTNGIWRIQGYSSEWNYDHYLCAKAFCHYINGQWAKSTYLSYVRTLINIIRRENA